MQERGRVARLSAGPLRVHSMHDDDPTRAPPHAIATQARGRMAEVEVDLANKPAWLARFSPTGKVPAICYMEG